MNRYQIVETAFGYCAVAFSVHPFKLVEIKLPTPALETLCQPFDEACWRMDNTHSKGSTIAAALAGYFNGEQIDIPWSVMDLSRFTPSQQAVYRTVAKIPYGETASYGQVAGMAGFPRAARFVGTTMANNRYPVFIPCHRVIKSDGLPGGFGGGEPLKIRMLALEAGD